MAKSEVVQIEQLEGWEKNPRGITKEDYARLKKQIQKLGVYKPLIVYKEDGRFIVLGGNMRLQALKELNHKKVWVSIVEPKSEEEKVEISLSDNDRAGYYEEQALAELLHQYQDDINFEDYKVDLGQAIDIQKVLDELQSIRPEENFDITKELEKLKIEGVNVKKGDVYQLGAHRLMCGDCTKEDEMLKLMNGNSGDFCFTDPPYDLSYLKGGKGHGTATKGFGYKGNRQYLETDEAPLFEEWMPIIKDILKENSHIIVFENWKNIVPLWQEMEKHWKIRNMIVWHLPNRCQGFAGKYRFFNKHDIAIVGAAEDKLHLNLDEEEGELQNRYLTALYAIGGKPYWRPYRKGSVYCPTDFIEFRASDEKHSGQGIIFGTKPVEILIPYIKVLTRRNDLIVEPFGGSGSTLIASQMVERRCYLLEKVPIDCEVIKKRLENYSGQKAEKL